MLQVCVLNCTVHICRKGVKQQTINKIGFAIINNVMTNRTTIILFHLGPTKSKDFIQRLARMWEAFIGESGNKPHTDVLHVSRVCLSVCLFVGMHTSYCKYPKVNLASSACVKHQQTCKCVLKVLRKPQTS